jgi:hypothetical protein
VELLLIILYVILCTMFWDNKPSLRETTVSLCSRFFVGLIRITTQFRKKNYVQIRNETFNQKLLTNAYRLLIENVNYRIGKKSPVALGITY